MHIDLLIYAGLIAVSVRLIHVLYNISTSPLRDIPGPFAARFTRLWYLRSIWKGQAHWDDIALHRKYAQNGNFYAPIVRVGPNMYSITRPEKVVYGISSKMEKSPWYEGWKHPSPDRWSVFSDRNITRHAETRRKFQSMYSMSSLLHYEAYAETAQDVFRQRLIEMTQQTQRVNMHHWLQCYAFDVIGNITYGRRFGFLDEGKDVEHMMASLEASMVYSSLVGVYCWAHPTLFKIMENIPGSGAAGRAYIMRFVRKQIAEREAKRAEDEKKGATAHKLDAPRDFLDLAMDAEEDPEKGMTKYNVFMMGMSNVIAGSDTTAVSLSSVLYHLLKYPRTMALLRAEFDQAITDGRMTPDRLTFKESQSLPYLQACIKEGLRLCSATGLPLFRVVPAGGVEIDGKFFPEGTEIGVHIW